MAIPLLPPFLQAVRIARCPELSLLERLRVLAFRFRMKVGRARITSDVQIRVGRVTLTLDAESLETDWNVFTEVFLEREYAAGTYSAATVIDVGAHKGYFAAFALANGAKRVLSYEPEMRNFEFLVRSADGIGDRWTIRNAALNAAAGTAELHLRESWSHSIYPDSPSAQTQIVPAVTFDDISGEAATSCGQLLVKIDIEGAEHAVMGATTVDSWRCVDEVLMEIHASPTSTGDLLAQPIRSGLRLVRGGPAEKIAHLLRADEALTRQ